MTDKAKQEKPPFGTCPVSSRGQAIPIPKQASIAQPGVIDIEVKVVEMRLPCNGPDCQWWMPDIAKPKGGCCAIQHLTRLNFLENIPPN
jgi:hypothetical protein